MKNLILIFVTFISISAFSVQMDNNEIEPVQNKIKVDETIVTINNIYFEENQSILNDASIKTLDILINVLNENPEMKICIASYTNIAEGCPTLSKMRSFEVKKYLVQNWIDESRLRMENFGNSKQVNDTNSEKLDRRVEFIFE